MADLPGHSWPSIRTKGNKLGIRRRPWIPKPTGKPVLDQIRRRAADFRISLAELDRICATGHHFEKSSQSCEPRGNAWLRAITALGGRVEIIWE